MVEHANRIKDLISNIQPHIICLIETKTYTNHLNHICRKFSRVWNWVAIVANGLSGGIIILWSHSLKNITSLAATKMSLHLVIFNEDDRWILSAIYNLQLVTEHHLLWRTLSRLANLKIPWLLARDFNAILSEDEHKGGSFNSYAYKSKLFFFILLTLTIC